MACLCIKPHRLLFILWYILTWKYIFKDLNLKKTERRVVAELASIVHLQFLDVFPQTNQDNLRLTSLFAAAPLCRFLTNNPEVWKWGLFAVGVCVGAHAHSCVFLHALQKGYSKARGVLKSQLCVCAAFNLFGVQPGPGDLCSPVASTVFTLRFCIEVN